MKIYFEKFGEGHEVDFLTPMKIYEAVEYAADGSVAKIKDDEGDEIFVGLIYDSHIGGSSWKLVSEETRTKSDVDIVASIESERSALVNSIDSVNELLDSLSVPKAETLSERIKLAVSKEHFTVG